LRVKIVLGLLLVLFVATGAMMATRERVAHTAPAGPLVDVDAGGAPDAGATTALADGGDAGPAVDAGPARLFDRTLSVVTLGWDLAAPAVLANAGLEPSDKSELTAAGVPTRVRPLESMAAVEGALARGGEDHEGADVAVVPLSELTASYERLRALSPEVFFVVGWSHGREALVTSRDGLPDRPYAAPSAVGGATPALPMVGAAGEAATMLGLFALDMNGVAPSAVRLVARTDNPPLAAVDRDAPADGARQTILLTTADASRLVPFVAVAQHGLLEQSPRALVAWTHAWIEAARKLESGAPAAARTIAGAPGAPEPIALLKRLGEIAPAGLGDNARAFGLSGRGAVTLDALFQQSWRLWRGVGALATPAPDSAPINGSIVAALVRSYPSLAAPPVRPKPLAASPDTLKVLLTLRQPEGKVDVPALLASAGLLADVFERGVLRISVTKAGAVDAAATKRLADDIVQRFDVAPERLVVTKKAPPKAGAAIEVLVAP
jgi:hypothetical protein